MTNETIEGLKRLSWLPDRTDGLNGTLIGGQEYYDVYFTGGRISGLDISGLDSPNDWLNAILPAQAGQSGKVLGTDGSDASWVATASGGITQLTGDGTAGPGSGSQAFTLATVNSNTGSFGSSTAIPSFTVNGKGLITAASTNAVVAPAGTLSGATLASGVTASSLTSFGNSPTLVTPTLGVASATSINKVSITAPATSATLTIADGKTLACSNSLTLTGTDSSSVAFGTGGNVVYDNVTTLSSLASIGTITTGTWNAGNVTSSGPVLGSYLLPTGSGAPANGIFRPSTNVIATSSNNNQITQVGTDGFYVICTQHPDATHEGTFLSNPSGVESNKCSAGVTADPTQLWQWFNTNGQVGDITVSGSTTAYNTTSDANFKENPQPIATSGAIIDGLNPVAFTWKTVTAETGYGVLAQNAYEVFPDAVSVGTTDPEILPDDPNYKKWGVDYSKFIPILLAEIKSLRQRVAVLEM